MNVWIFFCAENGESPSSAREQADSDPYKRAEKWLLDVMIARTASQVEVIIKDAAPIDLDVNP